MTEIELAPIVLFVYNRPIHAEQTLNALMQNELADRSKLYIYCDGPKNNASDEQKNNIKTIKELVRKKKWCKEVEIIESDVNKGLANSIIEGVSAVIAKHKRAIVLEDDLVTSTFFLRFMNDALNFYSDDNRIFSIGGVNYLFPTPAEYKHDVFIVHRTESCGWATWEDRWNKVDWSKTNYDDVLQNKKKVKLFNRGGNDLSRILQLQIEGKVDSWAIRWDYCHYMYDAYCLRPIRSFIENIGFDGTGIHSDKNNGKLFSGLPYNQSEYNISFVSNIQANSIIEQNFKNIFGSKPFSFIQKIKSVIIKLRRRVSKLRRKLKIKKNFIYLFRTGPVSRLFGIDRGMPIDRIYIEDFLKINRADISGRVLEIANSFYSEKYGTDVSKFLVLNYEDSPNASIVGDLSKLGSIPDNIADCFICTQTLNFIYDVKAAIQGSYDLLSTGGVFLGTMAGISQISRYDMDKWGDYWRFTDLSIKKMFGEVFGEDNVEVKTYGNALATTAFLQGIAVGEIPNSKKLMFHDSDYQMIIGVRAVKL